MEKKILDATCGSRMIWFDKNNPAVLYVDRRTVDNEVIWTDKSGKKNDIRLNIKAECGQSLADRIAEGVGEKNG